MEVSGYRKSVQRLLTGFGVIWLVLLGLFLANMMTPGAVVGTLVTLVLLTPWLTLLYPTMRFKRPFEAMALKNDGDMHRRVEFFDEDFAVISRSKVKRFFYEEVIRIGETRNLFLLECGEGVNIMVSKSGFSSGNWPEVRAKLIYIKESVK